MNKNDDVLNFNNWQTEEKYYQTTSRPIKNNKKKKITNLFWNNIQNYKCKFNTYIQKILLFIYKSDIWINFFNNNHIIILNLDTKIKKNTFIFLKNIQIFFENFSAKLLILITYYYNKKITLENIRIITLVNIFLLFKMPILISNKENELKINKKNNKVFHDSNNVNATNTYQINKFNIYSQFEEKAKNSNNMFKENEEDNQDKENTKKTSNKSNLFLIQSIIDNKINNMFKNNLCGIFENFKKSFEEECFNNEFINENIFSKKWINFFNYHYCIFVSVLFELLNKNDNHLNLIKKYSIIFKYLLLYMIIEKSFKFYKNMKYKGKNIKYKFYSNFWIVNDLNYYKVLKIKDEIKKKLIFLITKNKKFKMNIKLFQNIMKLI